MKRLLLHQQKNNYHLKIIGVLIKIKIKIILSQKKV